MDRADKTNRLYQVTSVRSFLCYRRGGTDGHNDLTVSDPKRPFFFVLPEEWDGRTQRLMVEFMQPLISLSTILSGYFNPMNHGSDNIPNSTKFSLNASADVKWIDWMPIFSAARILR